MGHVNKWKTFGIKDLFFSCRASSEFCGTRNASTRPLTLKSRTCLQCRLALARDVPRQQSKVAKPYGRPGSWWMKVRSTPWYLPPLPRTRNWRNMLIAPPNFAQLPSSIAQSLHPPPSRYFICISNQEGKLSQKKKKAVNVCVKQPATTRTTCSNWSEPIPCEHTHTQENPNW